MKRTACSDAAQAQHREVAVEDILALLTAAKPHLNREITSGFGVISLAPNQTASPKGANQASTDWRSHTYASEELAVFGRSAYISNVRSNWAARA